MEERGKIALPSCRRCGASLSFTLRPEEIKLLEVIREVGWGLIKEIEIKNGTPKFLRLEVIRDIKLDAERIT